MAQLICNRAYKPLKNETDPFRALSKAVSGDSLDKMILVVPTGKLVRRLLNTVVREYFGRYKKPVSKPAIYTLKGFVQSIFSRIPESREYRLISDAYRLALVEEAAAKADLKFFARNNKNVSPSILDRLANIIYGLKEDGISYDDLYEDLDDENTDYDKLNDIANLYRAYEDILGEKYLDFPGLLNKTIEYFGESDLTDSSELFPEKNEIDKFFDKGAEILFYGFSEFKKPEEMFISLFSDSRIPLGINIDYDTSNGPLFSNLESVIINLKDNGFDLYDSRDLKGKSGEFHIVTNLAAVKEAGLKEDPLSLPPVTYIRRWLFNNEKEIRYPELSGQISIVEAPSRTEEARFVVKLAGKLITDDGYKPSDICIVCRHLDMYSGLYRELFEEYGVPMNVTDRFPLTGSPVAAAIFSILDIINNGYKRKDIHKALKSRYLSFSKDNPADTENLIDSAMRLRIEGGHRRGGRKFWETRLSGRIKFLKEKLYDLKKDDNNDPLEISNIKESLAKAQKALYDFTGMADSLPDVENLMNPADFVRIIKDKIIAAYDIRGNIIANFEKIKKIKQNLNAIEYIRLMEKVEQDSAAFTAFLEILDEMEFILTDRTPEKKFRPAELTEILKTAMSGGKYQVKEKRNLGITVTTIEQIRGAGF